MNVFTRLQNNIVATFWQHVVCCQLHLLPTAILQLFDRMGDVDSYKTAGGCDFDHPCLNLISHNRTNRCLQPYALNMCWQAIFEVQGDNVTGFFCTISTKIILYVIVWCARAVDCPGASRLCGG